MTNEELVQAFQSGEKAMLAELWEQNTGLIKWWANRYVSRTTVSGKDTNAVELFDDLFQCGYLALASAAETFDTAAGGSFANWYGYYFRREVYSLMGWRNRTDPETGKPVTVALDALAHAGSLDAPLGDDPDGATLQDTIADPEDAYTHSDRQMYLDQLRTALDEAVGSLFDILICCGAKMVPNILCRVIKPYKGESRAMTILLSSRGSLS